MDGIDEAVLFVTVQIHLQSLQKVVGQGMVKITQVFVCGLNGKFLVLLASELLWESHLF
jgi:hypothetical protein